MTAICSIITIHFGGEGKGYLKTFAMILIIVSLCVPGVSAIAAKPSEAKMDSGCWFHREDNPDAPAVTVPLNLKSVRMANYFRIFYPTGDTIFADSDRDGIPEILQKQKEVFERSKHLLQTELGWKIPVSTVDGNIPELNVYFVSAERRFTSTTHTENQVQVLFNRTALLRSDFAAIWIHQLTHAAELQYKTDGEYWFYEATAGWMEGEFSGASRQTKDARKFSLEHPEIPLTDSNPVAALGTSRFVEMLGRPYKDVIRQIWEAWSFSKDDNLIEIIRKVLEVNHLPKFESYLQNYFLLSTSKARLDMDSADVTVKPFSAAMYTGFSDQSQGGTKISFQPEDGGSYSISTLFFAVGEKSGTLAMEPGLHESWSIQIPYTDMDHYSVVIVNHSSSELRGKIQKSFDASIPAVLEYFHVSPGEGGVQIEWKTAKENGVAFWNLYRVMDGQKERLNDFPIPAAISSEEGIHYLFLDSTGGTFYTLEAITKDGFQSQCAGSEMPQ